MFSCFAKLAAKPPIQQTTLQAAVQSAYVQWKGSRTADASAAQIPMLLALCLLPSQSLLILQIHC